MLHIGTFVEKKLDKFWITVLSCQIKSSSAGLVSMVDVSTTFLMLQKTVCSLSLALDAGPAEGSHAL